MRRAPPQDRVARGRVDLLEPALHRLLDLRTVETRGMREIGLEEDAPDTDLLDVPLLELLEPVVRVDLPPVVVARHQLELGMLRADLVPEEVVVGRFQHERHPPDPALGEDELELRKAR